MKKYILAKVLVIIILSCLPFSIKAQTDTSAIKDTSLARTEFSTQGSNQDISARSTSADNSSAEMSDFEDDMPLGTPEMKLSVIVLLFGFLVLLIELYLIKIQAIPADSIIKFILITLIITGTLYMITAGFGNDQISPAVGLFGTVAGYLLGKSTPKDGKD